MRPELDAAPARPRWPARWRFAIALSAALVAHGLLLLLLSRAQPERAQPPRKSRAPVTIDLQFVPPRSAPVLPAAPSQPGLEEKSEASAKAEESAIASERAPRNPASQTARSKASSPAPSSVAPPSRSNGSTATADRIPVALRPHDEAWAKAEGLGPSQAPAAQFGISRVLRDPLAALGVSPDAKRPGAGKWNNGYGEGPQGPVRVPTKEEALAEEQTRVEMLVESGLNDELALARARDVRDGYWQDVQDILEKGFSPDWSLLDEHPAKSPAVSPVRQIFDDYRRVANNYGKSGSPFVSAGPGAGGPAPDVRIAGAPSATMNSDLSSALNADRGLRGTVMDSQIEVVRQIENAGSGTEESPFLKRLVVHVMLTQRADGELEEIALAGSSGNAVYDALVLGQARKLSVHGLLGAPPKSRRRTLWAFEAEFLQTPPMPVAGCQLDTLFIPQDCFYPFKKSVKSKVKLEAVY